jgi:hypothetical protein
MVEQTLVVNRGKSEMEVESSESKKLSRPTRTKLKYVADNIKKKGNVRSIMLHSDALA